MEVYGSKLKGAKMGYPVAYRSGARRYGGGSFQEPSPRTPGVPNPPRRDPMRPPYKAPPKPDNDPLPPPANDNKPGRGRGGHSPFPKITPPFPGIEGPAAKQAVKRFIPPQLRTAWELGRIAFDFGGDFMAHNQMPKIEMPPGWNVGCGPITPPIGYTGRFAFHEIGTEGTCGLPGQALCTGSVQPGSIWTKCSLAKQEPNLGRWFMVSFWSRSVGAKEALKARYKYWMNTAPKAFPEPIPWTKAEPLPEIVPEPQGYEVPAHRAMPATLPRARPAYNYRVADQPWLSRDPWKNIGDKPGLVINPPGVVINPVRRPPGKGVKERKVRAQGSFAVFNGLLSEAAGLYEDAKFAMDIVDAFYYALPGKHGAKTPEEKLRELYRRWDEVNIQEAVKGVLIAVAGEKAGAYLDRARRLTADNLGANMYISIPTGSAPKI